jgi:hypothetical protein
MPPKAWIIAAGAAFLWMAACAGPGHYIAAQGDSAGFFLNHPDAADVRLAVSTDGFQLHQAREIKPGLWMAAVPLRDDMTYFFVVDGRPYIPDCPYKQSDDFGSENCVFMMPR